MGWTLGVEAEDKGRALARDANLFDDTHNSHSSACAKVAGGPVARTRTCAGSGGEVQRVARAEGREL